ncbi:hypothetical protein JCGZ_24058 [Jatropha curcas]|uniref:Uncharacterized protein n=1 Tax=Jatropha curcas TaxID=180498 RepID=A0A067LQK1_JATCU|nr:uncharacterized protein LOC105649933 [Jatropha curcas]KDP46849.1 hypothetical protein JCGZ_24058 [Jatropha curcas]
MAPLLYFSFRKLVLLYLVFFLFITCMFLSASSSGSSQLESNKQFLENRRKLLEVGKSQDQDQDSLPKKKSSITSMKNQTKLMKPNLSTKNQTKLIKNSLSTKNQTKITNSTNSNLKNELKKLNSTSQLKKLNSTSLKKLNSTSKPYNSTKATSSKKTSDLLKLGSPKNKTTKSISTKESLSESQKQTKNQKISEKKPAQKNAAPKQPSWLDQEVEDDLVAEFRDLPSKFQQSLLPDLERISITSKKYLNKANKEMTKGFKPIVGNKYASTIATIISFVFIIVPLLLVSLIFNRFKAYFSIQKIVIFIQIYLSIYFSILCLSSVVTGLEPLRFFYATSQSTYVCLMVLQTLGYVLYLLLLLMYLILVFSTDCGLGSKILGLGQTIVGIAVGLHFYVAVFHRVVLHQPPKTTWKVHAIYATCFIVICFFARFERRKKAYMEEGGEEGKKN